MHARRDGVDANLGARPVTTLALERDAKTVYTRKCRAAIEHQAERRLTVDVHGKGSLGARVLEQAVGDGSACPSKVSSPGWNSNFTVALASTSSASRALSKRAAPSRAVAYIVAAGMHATVGGSERLARFLGNGQGIHVAAKHDNRTGLLVCARTIALSSRGRTGTDQANNTGAVDKRGMGMSISSRRAWI